MDKCPKCGYEKEVDYFKLINKLKEEYELKNGIEARDLVIGVKEYFKMENSQSLLDRLIYIKDTASAGVLGSYILGLKIIKAINIEGIKIGNLL